MKYITKIRDVLGLDRDELPELTTIHESFDRLKIWEELDVSLLSDVLSPVDRTHRRRA